VIADDVIAVPPPAVWVDHRLAPGPSPIEGRGLFALAPIAEAEVVLRLGGRLVGSAELDALIAATDSDPTLPYVDTLTIDEDAHLVLPTGTAAHHCNHSCDPNLWWAGSYSFAARTAIAAGAEVTIDYATISGADGFVMDCTCGAAACRGVVTSDDWRIADLQERFRGHWVPALEQRIHRAAEGAGDASPGTLRTPPS
jgi:hypothetical protein